MRGTVIYVTLHLSIERASLSEGSNNIIINRSTTNNEEESLIYDLTVKHTHLYGHYDVCESATKDFI